MSNKVGTVKLRSLCDELDIKVITVIDDTENRGGGSGGSETGYRVKVINCDREESNYTAKFANRRIPKEGLLIPEGTKVSVSVLADKGYIVDTFRVLEGITKSDTRLQNPGNQGNDTDITVDFTMPAKDVIICATTRRQTTETVFCDIGYGYRISAVDCEFGTKNELPFQIHMDKGWSKGRGVYEGIYPESAYNFKIIPDTGVKILSVHASDGTPLYPMGGDRTNEKGEYIVGAFGLNHEDITFCVHYTQESTDPDAPEDEETTEDNVEVVFKSTKHSELNFNVNVVPDLLPENRGTTSQMQGSHTFHLVKDRKYQFIITPEEGYEIEEVFIYEGVGNMKRLDPVVYTGPTEHRERVQVLGYAEYHIKTREKR